MTYRQNGSATSLQRLNTQPGSHCARSCPGEDAGGEDRNLQRAPPVNNRGSGVFRGSLPDIAGSVPQTRGTAPVAVIASFGGRVEASAQFHQNSRSCSAGRPATDTAVVDSTSAAKCRDPDQHGEGGDRAVSRILKPAHHPRPTRHPPGLRQTSAGVNVTLSTLQTALCDLGRADGRRSLVRSSEMWPES